MKVLFLNRLFFILNIIILVIILLLFNFSSISSFNNCNIPNIQNNKENLTEREKLIFQAFQEKKVLAITFDDGPGKFTDDLVEELKKRNVPATFFILGTSTKEYGNLLNKISQDNEIGIHGYSHKLFTKLTNEDILKEIQKTEEIIAEKTNIAPKIIRVPYGALNNRVRDLLKDNGYISLTWTVDSKDWSYRNIDKTYNHVLKHVHGNEIILMHDIYKTSVIAAIKLIDYYKANGYMFVTVSEFLKVKDQNE
ncbi:MAG: polysaccharide deacetylase family protein [Clostridia bacterium]